MHTQITHLNVAYAYLGLLTNLLQNVLKFLVCVHATFLMYELRLIIKMMIFLSLQGKGSHGRNGTSMPQHQSTAKWVLGLSGLHVTHALILRFGIYLISVWHFLFTTFFIYALCTWSPVHCAYVYVTQYRSRGVEIFGQFKGIRCIQPIGERRSCKPSGVCVMDPPPVCKSSQWQCESGQYFFLYKTDQ